METVQTFSVIADEEKKVKILMLHNFIVQEKLFSLSLLLLCIKINCNHIIIDSSDLMIDSKMNLMRILK